MRKQLLLGMAIGVNLVLAAFFLMSISTTDQPSPAPEIANTVSADPFIGEITMFAGNFAPRGWAKCDGQLLPIAQNTALFSLLGTTYGGDGRTTFALPDLRGRVAIHPGNGAGLSSYKMGQKGGYESAISTTALRGSLTLGGTSNGGSAISTIQPYQTVHYIIALQGTYPSRS
ncbi:MAG: hypothetical protein Sapg2KO_31890 [Saprospiraceae bacterium]